MKNADQVSVASPAKAGDAESLDSLSRKVHNQPMPKPAPTDLVSPQWKRNPAALWLYIAAGVGMILWSGARVTLERIGLRR